MEQQPESSRSVAVWVRALSGVLAILFASGVYFTIQLNEFKYLLYAVILVPIFAFVAITGRTPRAHLLGADLSERISLRRKDSLNGRMNHAALFRAILPGLIASVAIGFLEALVSPRVETPLIGWVIGGVCGGLLVVVVPFWAGVRVARVGGLRRWSTLAGVYSGLPGNLVNLAIFPAPWADTLPGVVFALPVFAFFGFLGGVWARFRRSHGA